MNEYKNYSMGLGARSREFYRILCAYNRHSELNRLIMWASRKRLKKPLHLYTNRLQDTEGLLFNYRYQSPKTAKLAHFVHRMAQLLFPAQHYLAKGSAQGYRYGKT